MSYSLLAAMCPIPTDENFGVLDIQVTAREIIASVSIKKSNGHKLKTNLSDRIQHFLRTFIKIERILLNTFLKLIQKDLMLDLRNIPWLKFKIPKLEAAREIF